MYILHWLLLDPVGRTKMTKQHIDTPHEPLQEVRGHEHVPELRNGLDQHFEKPLKPNDHSKTASMNDTMNNNTEFPKEGSSAVPYASY